MTCWIYNGWHWGIKDLRSKARKHTSRNSKLLLQQSYTFGDCMSINITPLFFKKLYFILFQICNLRLLHSNCYGCHYQHYYMTHLRACTV
uniref:Uncharacterized protein n=1 Tax=Anguilla anguilla TaxID=7936 RepID=A0A0E9WPR5_ANGAN